MAAPISLKNKKFHQGLFQLKNPSKYVGDKTKINYKSGLEKTAMIFFDMNPDILKWNSEGLVIPYFSKIENKMRKYYVDFVIEVKTKDNKIVTYLVEVKPDKETRPPKEPKVNKIKSKSNYLKECYNWSVNSDKWDAARKFAESKKCKFIIITEKDLKK